MNKKLGQMFVPEENKKFKCTSPQDMNAGLKDHTYWYIADEIEIEGRTESRIVSVKDMNDLGMIAYLFEIEDSSLP